VLKNECGADPNQIYFYFNPKGKEATLFFSKSLPWD